MNEFKIRCSAISDIMGPLQGGLTDKQRDKLEMYQGRNSQCKERFELEEKLKEPVSLGKGAKSYCEEWIMSEVYGSQPVFDRKMEKGNRLEDDAIRFMGYEPQHKTRMSDNYLSGECDLLLDEAIVDIKCPWSHTTFPILETELPEKAYWWQGQGYMHLYKRKHYRVAYVLMTTPADLDEYGLNYDNLPKHLRIKTFEFDYDPLAISKVEERVRMCREYIETLRRDLRLDEF